MSVLYLIMYKLHSVSSLKVEACFTYTANPKSYAPRLGELIHIFDFSSSEQIQYRDMELDHYNITQ